MTAALPWRLGPSALTRFRTCERQFQLVDVEHLGREERRHPLLVQGSAIHAALNLFFGLAPNDRNPPEEKLTRALRRVWRTYWKPKAMGDSNLELNMGCSAIAKLAEFPNYFDTTIVPFAREQWVSVRLPSGFELCGRIDRIDPYQDGLDLVDYKTGRRRLDDDDLPREAATQVYALAAEATIGLPVHRVRQLYLGSGEEIAWWPEPEDLAALAERLVELTDRMHETDFPANPGAHCAWCPVALACPDRGRVRLADLTPTDTLPF